MLTNLLRYKDYYAHIAFDPSADTFHGRVIGIQDAIDFYGRTPLASLPWRRDVTMMPGLTLPSPWS